MAENKKTFIDRILLSFWAYNTEFVDIIYIICITEFESLQS